MGKILSGGQTGVDRAALDAAMELGIPVGGYVPRGRLAEDGRVPDRYPMTETASDRYPVRTRMNVQAADGTLVISPAGRPLEGGSQLTVDLCLQLDVPLYEMLLSPDSRRDKILRKARRVQKWIEDWDIYVLNVAGSRESKCPGIYDSSKRILLEIFRDAPNLW